MKVGTNVVAVRCGRGVRSVLASLAALAALIGLGTVPAAAAGPPRMDLRVLVVSDGTPWVEAIRSQLASEGVSTTVVSLSDSARPAITSGFLADQLGDGTPHAKFDGVVLPSEAPSGLAASEQSALASFERQYGVRQVDGFVYPTPAVGLNYPSFAGPLDGVTTTLSTAGLGDAFRYLRGPVKFEDNDPAVAESYGYLTTALPDDPATGAHFEPYLTATIPGTTTQGTLAGVYRVGGQEQLVLGFAYNYYQQQYRLLAHGVVDWVTKGVHLGYWRNYLSVHVDDVFNDDSRWDINGHCTPGNDCPPGVAANTSIRMVPNDVTAAVQWQQQNNFTLDLLYNGGASDLIVAQQGSDPLTNAFTAVRNQFRWLNHTYTHQFLGCVQDFTVVPWRCQTDAAGQMLYVSRQVIDSEVNQNVAWAQNHGLPINPAELVAGEHSGTKILPQQPNDNPNFIASLTADRIKWLGLDASREPTQRPVGSANGVPRHPLNIFYNVANPNEEVAEYNWIYTSRANGGSGLCEDQPATTTCITPLDPATGFSSYIVPKQVQIMLSYALANDPRPFYVHQSNLTEGKVAYPVLTGVLASYRRLYAANTPVVEQTLTAAGQVLQKQDSWAHTQSVGTVSAYMQGSVVTVTGPAGTVVPITVPTGTRVGSAIGAAFGTAYAGERSNYVTIGATSTVTLTLPSMGTGGAAPLLALGLPGLSAILRLAPQSQTSKSAINTVEAARTVNTPQARASAPTTLLVPVPARLGPTVLNPGKPGN